MDTNAFPLLPPSQSHRMRTQKMSTNTIARRMRNSKAQPVLISSSTSSMDLFECEHFPSVPAPPLLRDIQPPSLLHEKQASAPTFHTCKITYNSVNLQLQPLSHGLRHGVQEIMTVDVFGRDRRDRMCPCGYRNFEVRSECRHCNEPNHRPSRAMHSPAPTGRSIGGTARPGGCLRAIWGRTPGDFCGETNHEDGLDGALEGTAYVPAMRQMATSATALRRHCGHRRLPRRQRRGSPPEAGGSARVHVLLCSSLADAAAGASSAGGIPGALNKSPGAEAAAAGESGPVTSSPCAPTEPIPPSVLHTRHLRWQPTGIE